MPSANPNRQNPLTPASLLAEGPFHRLVGGILVMPEIDSTNDYLLKNQSQLPDGTILAAEYQTAGRGRQNRRWAAPRGSSLLVSVLLHEPRQSALRTTITQVAAIAACDAIRASTGLEAMVRWPNDLVLQQKKVGGVLAEVREPPGGAIAIVIGIGINCWQQRAHFPPELHRTATSLEIESEQPVDRTAVGAALLRKLDEWLVTASSSDELSELADAWRNRCADYGQRVTLLLDTRRYTGSIVDIAPDGDLIVELDQGGRRHFGAATTTRVWD